MSSLTIAGTFLLTDRPAHPEMTPDGYRLSACLECWLAWDNAWANDKNHDAVWLFVKLKGLNGEGERSVRHAPLLKDPVILSHEGDNERPQLAASRAKDGTGALLKAQAPYRGRIRARLRFEIDPKALAGLAWESIRAEVFGLEMVFIPEGPFFAGAASLEELAYGAYHLVGPDGGFAGPYPIRSEAEIEVGDKPSRLSYRSLPERSHQGDATGPIPAAFPKGFKAFYIMKYEAKQGDYAAFLNWLDGYGPDARANFAGPTYYDERGTLRLEKGAYVAGAPDRPLNFVSWEDSLAFLEWSGLRPMSELEYEKAARGARRPKPFEFVWGNAQRDRLERQVLPCGDLGQANGAKEEELNDQMLEVFGASHFWVMDLSGSLWQRAITLGDPRGRAFTGAHGQGQPTPYGEAIAPNWPREGPGPRRWRGFGYRGGGSYEFNRAYDLYRPHSPVALRPFGSWSGGPRHKAYGLRGVRSADS